MLRRIYPYQITVAAIGKETESVPKPVWTLLILSGIEPILLSSAVATPDRAAIVTIGTINTRQRYCTRK
jgi:hypothetical protein